MVIIIISNKPFDCHSQNHQLSANMTAIRCSGSDGEWWQRKQEHFKI